MTRFWDFMDFTISHEWILSFHSGIKPASVIFECSMTYSMSRSVLLGCHTCGLRPPGFLHSGIKGSIYDFWGLNFDLVWRKYDRWSGLYAKRRSQMDFRKSWSFTWGLRWIFKGVVVCISDFLRTTHAILDFMVSLDASLNFLQFSRRRQECHMSR